MCYVQAVVPQCLHRAAADIYMSELWFGLWLGSPADAWKIMLNPVYIGSQTPRPPFNLGSHFCDPKRPYVSCIQLAPTTG